MRFSSGLATVAEFPNWRRRFPLLVDIRCPLNAFLRVILPLAVTFTRYFSPLWGFILFPIASRPVLKSNNPAGAQTLPSGRGPV